MTDKLTLERKLQLKKIITLYIKETNDMEGLTRRVNYGQKNKINIYELLNSKKSDLNDLIRVYRKIPESYFKHMLSEESNKKQK